MSKLVPEKRVDKNGRVVTKHVLDAAPPSMAGRAFPVPVAATEKKRLASKLDYGTKIAKALLGPDEVIKGQNYYSTRLSMKALRRVNAWVDALAPDNERDRDIFAQALNKITFKDDADSPIARDRLACILVEIMPVITEFAPEKSVRIPWSVNELVSAVNYGAKVNRILFETKSDADTTAMLQYTAFEHAVKNVNTARPQEWLREESRWFMDNFERLSMYRETIIKRGSTDRDFLDELVAGDRAASLGEGAL
jgi:hypothetical protein